MLASKERGKALLLAGVDADAKVMCIQQRAGDMVQIPPGYPHQVHTLIPSLKIAWARPPFPTTSQISN